MAMQLTDKELGLALEWFGTAEDLAHGEYLKKADYKLAHLILVHLGRRVPKSILQGEKAA